MNKIIQFIRNQWLLQDRFNLFVLVLFGSMLIVSVYFASANGQITRVFEGQTAIVIESFDNNSSIQNEINIEELTPLSFNLSLRPFAISATSSEFPLSNNETSDTEIFLTEEEQDFLLSLVGENLSTTTDSDGEERSRRGGGGGGGSNPNNDNDLNNDSGTPTSTPENVSDPVITSPADNATTTDTTILFEGTSDPNVEISQDFNSIVTNSDSAGNWQMNLSGFSTGTTTINFIATATSSETSNQVSITVIVVEEAPASDTENPTIDSFDDENTTLATCQASSGTAPECDETTQSVTISWTTSDNVSVQSVQIIQDGDTATTFLISSGNLTVDLPQGSYTFEIKVTDTSGNMTTDTITVNITAPVPNTDPEF